MRRALLLTRIARLLLGVSRYSVLLVTIPAFSVDAVRMNKKLQQSICYGASALIANVSHENAPRSSDPS